MDKLYRKNQISNDIILRIMQETYLFDAIKVDRLLSELYFRYLNILDYINSQFKQGKINLIKLFELIEEARVILYFIGVIFCEDFGKNAIEIRLKSLMIEPLNFYQKVDQNIPFKIDNKQNALKLSEIIKFYTVLKYWKQKLPKRDALSQRYLDEGYFNHTKDKIIEKIEQNHGKQFRGEEWFWHLVHKNL